VDLEAELWAAIERSRHPKLAQALAGLRISAKLRTVWGVGRCEFFGRSNSYYQPAEDGRRAVIVGVIEQGNLVDLAAADLATDDVATRLGIGRALGLDEIDRVRFNGGVLNLVERSFQWLRAPVSSACILDWRTAAFKLTDLDHPSTSLAIEPIEVHCSSLALAELVDAALRRPVPIPRLMVHPS
jgi:hypothetical protein